MVSALRGVGSEGLKVFKLAWVRAASALRRIPWRAVGAELAEAAVEAWRRRRAEKKRAQTEEPPAPPA